MNGFPWLFGAVIGHYRARRELTQRAVSADTKIAQSTLSRYESGDAAVPLEAALRLAAYFEMPLGAVIDDCAQLAGRAEAQDPTWHTRRPEEARALLAYLTRAS